MSFFDGEAQSEGVFEHAAREAAKAAGRETRRPHRFGASGLTPTEQLLVGQLELARVKNTKLGDENDALRRELKDCNLILGHVAHALAYTILIAVSWKVQKERRVAKR